MSITKETKYLPRSTAKKVLITVTCCELCPHYRYHRFDSTCVKTTYPRLLYDLSRIPDFCPLEDE